MDKPATVEVGAPDPNTDSQRAARVALITGGAGGLGFVTGDQPAETGCPLSRIWAWLLQMGRLQVGLMSTVTASLG